MTRFRLLFASTSPVRRWFSSSAPRREIRDVAELPEAIRPRYQETPQTDLLCLQWPAPPRNVLLTKKNHTSSITESLVEFSKHIHSTYSPVSIILERHVAEEVHGVLPFPVYTTPVEREVACSLLADKVDLISTLGGDGTILHASSLFAASPRVPPVLSFSMGTLGFLGEWKFREYKRAFREVYMSGARDHYGSAHSEEVEGRAAATNGRDNTGQSPHENVGTPTGWSSIRGKSMGPNRGARVLLRNRLKVGIVGPGGERIRSNDNAISDQGDVYAMNEIIIHRGRDPHLAVIEVFIGGRFLTEAVADGMIVSTPTGSTAYSLSSGGSIVHPLVSSLLLTPICPRSLSFRPLVLPANTPITLRLSEKNRGREVEVSIDGVRRPQGLGVGMEVHIFGEDIRDKHGNWVGGVPSVVRGAMKPEDMQQDHWVGGLNGLLGFNYPFGEK